MQRRKKGNQSRKMLTILSVIILAVAVIALGIFAVEILPGIQDRAKQESTTGKADVSTTSVTAGGVTDTDTATAESVETRPETFDGYLAALYPVWNTLDVNGYETVLTDLRNYAHEAMSGQDELAYEAVKYAAGLQIQILDAGNEKERYRLTIKLKTGRMDELSAWKMQINDMMLRDYESLIRLRAEYGFSIEGDISSVQGPENAIAILREHDLHEWPESVNPDDYIQEAYVIRKILPYNWLKTGFSLYMRSEAYPYVEGVDMNLLQAARDTEYVAYGVYALLDIKVNYEDAPQEEVRTDLVNYFGIEYADTYAAEIYTQLKQDPGCYLIPYAGYLQINQLISEMEKNGVDKQNAVRNILELGELPRDIIMERIQ